MRYRGTGPKFYKVSQRKVVYRWSDIRAYLEANMVEADQQITEILNTATIVEATEKGSQE